MDYLHELEEFCFDGCGHQFTFGKLDYSGHRFTWWQRGLLSSVHCEGRGPEPVVVRTLGMVEEQLPRLDHHYPVREEG